MKSRPRAVRADEAYRALRITWAVRWRLLRAAAADRRAGLPLGLGVETTPLLRALVAEHDDVCEHERASYLAEVGPLEVRLAEVEAEIAAAGQAVERHAAEVAAAAARWTDDELTVRRTGEHGLDETLVGRRRAAERDRLVTAARAARDDARSRLDDLHREAAALRARRTTRAALARSRVLRYGDHTDRLAACYRRALVHRHPQREQLLHQWRTDLRLQPAWPGDDDAVGAASIPEVAA